MYLVFDRFDPNSDGTPVLGDVCLQTRIQKNNIKCDVPSLDVYTTAMQVSCTLCRLLVFHDGADGSVVTS